MRIQKTYSLLAEPELTFLMSAEPEGGAAAPQGGEPGAAALPPSGVEPPGEPAPPAEGDWKDAMSDELKASPDIARYTSLEQMGQGLVNANKMIGRQSSDTTLNIPNSESPIDEINEFWDKLGRPETADKYSSDYQYPEGQEENKELMDGWRKAAYGLGISQSQFNGMVGWYNDMVTAEGEKSQLAHNAAVEESKEYLHKEFGVTYDKKIQQAMSVVEAYGTPGLVQMLDSGLGDSPDVVMFLSKIGEHIGEDKLVDASKDQSPFIITPAEAQSKIAAIQSNKDHAYHHQSNIGHNAAMKEMEELFKSAYPSQAPVGTVGSTQGQVG